MTGIFVLTDLHLALDAGLIVVLVNVLINVLNNALNNVLNNILGIASVVALTQSLV